MTCCLCLRQQFFIQFFAFYFGHNLDLRWGLASRSSTAPFKGSKSLCAMMNDCCQQNPLQTSRFPWDCLRSGRSINLWFHVSHFFLVAESKKRAKKQLFTREINNGKDTRWTWLKRSRKFSTFSTDSSWCLTVSDCKATDRPKTL